VTERTSWLSGLVGRRSPVTGAELAWQLVDVTAGCLESTDRGLLFADIACENYLSAVGQLLRAAADSGLPLRLSLLSRINDWLDGYRGTPEEPALRQLVERVKLSTLQSLPERQTRE
jgi:hypothetical protein